jgi:hypothetical protein
MMVFKINLSFSILLLFIISNTCFTWAKPLNPDTNQQIQKDSIKKIKVTSIDAIVSKIEHMKTHI